MINKNILTESIRSGMILAMDAIGPGGKVIVPKNTVLSQRFATRLANAGVRAVSVFIPDYIATEEEKEVPKPVTFVDRKDSETQNFRRALLEAAGNLSEALETIMVNPKADIDHEGLVASITALSEKYGNTLRVLELLQASRDFDDSIYIHSVGVALIARIVGIKAGVTEEKLHDLVLCALYHDIGKITIPEELLNKQGRLSEDELDEVRTHTTLGYTLLSKTNLPTFVAECALYHHERNDGSGYPDGITSDHIPLYAKYIAVADVYYAMTSKRSYREDICAFDVVMAFEEDGYKKYDVSALIPFLNCIAQSQIGSHVILNDGTEGNIIMLNKRLTRPIIKVGNEFIDLMRRSELEIIKIV